MFDKLYHGNASDEATDVLSLPTGEILVCGRTTSNSAGNYDGFVMKLNEKGNIVWSRTTGSSGFDELSKIKIASNGDIIVLGDTKSSSTNTSSSWLLRISSEGNIIWSKIYHYSASSTDEPTSLLALQDGSLAFTFNTNDQNTKSTGIIIKTGSDGTIQWSKKLANDNDDGQLCLAEKDDTLFAGGYALAGLKYAVITKINKNNGVVYNGLIFSGEDLKDSKVTSFEVFDNEYRISISRNYHEYTGTDNPYSLILARVSASGTIRFQRKTQLSTAQGNTIKKVTVITTPDSSFVYLYNDTTDVGNAKVVQFNTNGFNTWGRSFFNSTISAKMTGISATANGYVLAGYNTGYLPNGYKNIKVYKSNRTGKVADCTVSDGLDFSDTSELSFTNFRWRNTSDVTILTNSTAFTTVNSNFTEEVLCESQSCDTIYNPANKCNTSFFTNLQTDVSFFADDITPTKEGGYILAGTYKALDNLESALIKLNGAGNVLWSKKVGAMYHSAFFHKIIELKNGDLVAFAHDTYTENHGTADSTLIMRINANGDILWSRNYHFYYTTQTMDMVVTDDEDIILLNSTGNYTSISRLDGNGNIKWMREVNDVGGLSINKLLLVNNDLYAGGSINGQANSNPCIIKFSSQTGEIVWSKYIYVDITKPLIFSNLQCIKDTLVCLASHVNYYTDWPSFNHLAVIKLTTDGVIINGHEMLGFDLTDQFSSFNLDNYLATYVTKSADDNFVLSQKIYVNGQQKFNITKFNSDCNILWSRNYSNLLDYNVFSIKDQLNTTLVTGRKYTSVPQNQNFSGDIKSFVMKTNEQGYTAGDGDGTGNCKTDNFYITVQPLNIQSTDNPVLNTTIGTNYIYNSYQAHPITENHVYGKPSCYVPGSCTDISLLGADTLCNDTSEVIYKIQRNSGCTATAVWDINKDKFSVIEMNDSLVKLKPKSSGDVIINAEVNIGCAVQTLSKTVFVASGTNKFSLGDDTVICKGNTIVLHAGNDFYSYKWQDNSTNPDYTVSTAGNYFVSVQDYCRNTFSDTINVLQADNFKFDVTNDTTICSNDTLNIKVPAGFINYKWQPVYNIHVNADNSASVFPLHDTNYIVKAEKWIGCSVSDTIRISVLQGFPLFLGNDTVICAGNELTILAEGSFKSYKWSNGVTQSQITVKNQGIYSVEAVSKNGCISRDSLYVALYPLPQVYLGNDTLICAGSNYVLNAGSFQKYEWQDGQTSSTILINSPGLYSVKVTDNNNCVNKDTMTVIGYNPLPENFLPDTISMCEGESKTLKPSEHFNAYRWSNGQIASSITVNQSGLYWLTVINDKGCINTDSITIHYKDCINAVYFPSAFTPNHDGKNDVFKPKIYGNLSNYKLVIYNRFGMKIFETTEAYSGWDGNVGNQPQDSGTYIWNVYYRLVGSNQALHQEKGTLVLIK